MRCNRSSKKSREPWDIWAYRILSQLSYRYIPQEVIISCQGHRLSGVTYAEVCILHLVLFFFFIVVSSIQGHQSLFLHSFLLISLLFSFLSPIHSWASTERERKQKHHYFVLLFFLPLFFRGLPAFWCYC
jgi:hypothetical protein